MNTVWLLQIMKERGALYDDTHVVLVSGFHSDGYFNGAKILRHPSSAYLMASVMAALLEEYRVETVVGPMNGGGIWAQLVAWKLDWPKRTVSAAYATERGGIRVFDRDQVEVIAGKRVAVVDDVLTTGKTLDATIAAIKLAQGLVEVVGVICDRSGGKREGNSTPIVSLFKRGWKNWQEEDCSLCKEGFPIETRVGHGAEFLRAHPELATPEQKHNQTLWIKP